MELTEVRSRGEAERSLGFEATGSAGRVQVKQATASVLEAYLGKSRYRQPGQRVVQGQRMMQAASDIYLGWNTGDRANRYFYWRQLRDMKGSALVEQMRPVGLTFYARICAWTLARAHARSGDPDRDRLLPGHQRPVRQRDHRLRRALRRPERTGLHRVREGHPARTTANGRGRLTMYKTQARCADRDRAACMPGTV